MITYVKEKLAFESIYRGYHVKAWYLVNCGGDALIEIFKGGKMIRSFTFPAYKIYNIQAHFEDIVNYEMWLRLPGCVRTENFRDGYRAASWNGISGMTFIAQSIT